jgi:protein-tyrosine-phosphatase
MADRPYTVLFLCTGNSARSIMAEALLNHWGHGRFQAFSAGSNPRGHVHPLTIETLRQNRLPVDDLRSKSWDEFATKDAPEMDFIFTICDQAAEEVCPIWPGQPMTAHWGTPDPAAVEGTDEEKQRAFNRAFHELDARVKIFTALRLETLDELALKRHLDEIGQTTGAHEMRRGAR